MKREEMEGRFEVPARPRLLVADIQVSHKGETKVDVYELVADFRLQAGSLDEALRFVADKAEQFALTNVTIVQPIGVDLNAIEILRRGFGLRVNGRR